MLVTLPAGKTGFWVRWVGVPFDRAVRFHRNLGRLALAAATLHLLVSMTNVRVRVRVCVYTFLYLCAHVMYETARTRAINQIHPKTTTHDRPP